MDVIADITGIDARKLDSKILFKKRFSLSTKTHEAVIYDSGDFKASLEKLLS